MDEVFKIRRMREAFNGASGAQKLDDLFIHFFFESGIDNFTVNQDELDFVVKVDAKMVQEKTRRAIEGSGPKGPISILVKNGISYKIGDLTSLRIPMHRYIFLKFRYIGNDFNSDLAILLFRYQVLGGHNQHYAMPPFLLIELEIDVELFGTPLNTSVNYCSPYPEIESKFGSLGNFFDYKFQNGLRYTWNPPYINALMERALDHLLSGLADLDEYYVVCVIPIWDPETQTKFGLKNYKIPFPTYYKLKQVASSVAHGLKSDHQYYNYFRDEFFPISHTHIVVLNRGMTGHTAQEIHDLWKSLSHSKIE